VYEREGHVSQSCDCVVSVSWVLGLVPSGRPVDVEEEIQVVGQSSHDLSWGHGGATKWGRI